MSLRDIKRRIRSVKLTRKITRAIQMVAASKVKTAQMKALATRQYRDELLLLLARTGVKEFILPGMRPEGEHLYIVFSSDRGLCGSYNSAMLRYFMNTVSPENAIIITIGKKGFSALKSAGFAVFASFISISDKPTFQDSLAITKSIRDAIDKYPIAHISLLYQKFINAMLQKPEERLLFPAQVKALDDENHELKFEPSVKTVRDALEAHYLTLMLYQVMLEAVASEQSARMVAMEQASSNAADIIFDLTQNYNQLRQAAITKELIEIVAGSQTN